MSEQDKQQTPASGLGVGNLDNQELKALVQLMLLQQQETLEEKKAKRLAMEARDKQRRVGSAYNEAEQKEKQRICTHLKGGRKGPKSARIDYAVGLHRFIDGANYIRCLICAAKWKPQDTVEFLVRRNQQIPNHTGIGWAEAMKMVEQSTNTPTSSEVVMETRINVEQPDFSNSNVVEN